MTEAKVKWSHKKGANGKLKAPDISNGLNTTLSWERDMVQVMPNTNLCKGTRVDHINVNTSDIA